MTNESDPAPMPAPAVEEGPKPSSFYACLPEAFAFPFRRRGWAAIVGGAIVFTGLEFVFGIVIPAIVFVPIAGFAVTGIMVLFVGGYYAAFMLKTIGEVAGGEDAPPEWPKLTDFMDDIARPIFLILGTCLMAWGPWLIYRIGCVVGDRDPAAGGWLLGAVGAMYLPMALVAVSLYDSIGALNPVTVVMGIIKTMPAYVVAAVAFFLVCAVNVAIRAVIGAGASFGISPLTWGVSLYLLMVEMYILGRLYYTHSKRLGWFE